MKIELPVVKDTTFAGIGCGETFLYQQRLYMKCNTPNKAVELSCGVIHSFCDICYVEPIKTKVVRDE